jgi:hypothetical protein
MTLRVFACALALAGLAVGQPAGTGDFIGGPEHAGEEVTCDLPESLHLWNKGSAIDRAGMCVDTAAEMAGRWGNVPGIAGFRDYWAARAPGGNWPNGLVKQIRDYYAAKGLPEPPYVQYQGPDPAPLLDLIDRTGRMACVTYGWSPRYGHTIFHMVNCPKFGGRWAVCLDNNPVGISPGRKYEWVERREFVRRVKHPTGRAWVFVWLTPPPPPPPRNDDGK